MYFHNILAAASESSTGVVIISAALLAGVGAVFGVVLAWAKKAFHVEKDPRIEQIEEVLPGANCGGCGLPGCSGYAEAVVKEGVNPTLCAPGGPSCAVAIAKIMGLNAGSHEPTCALIHCKGENVANAFEYNGINDCRSAHALQAGFKNCRFGCLGLGTCMEACPFDAIVMNENGFPVIIEENCVSCGKCVAACPRNLIEIHKQKSFVHVQCKSHDKGKDVMSACKVGCIGCMKCVKECPVEAISMDNFLAKFDYDKCISCGKCVRACPTKAIGNFRKRRKPAPAPKA